MIPSSSVTSPSRREAESAGDDRDKFEFRPQRPTAVILGRAYDLEHAQAAYRQHVQSTFRYTYRRDFASLSPYEITSDAGWGCMLRAAQSLLAHTLCRHYLGADWRFPSHSPHPEEVLSRSKEYCDIVRWLLDEPGPDHLFSLHHLVQCGLRYDKLPGEWHSPSTAALVLRDCLRTHVSDYGGEVDCLVSLSDTLYVDEIERHCCDVRDNDHTLTHTLTHAFSRTQDNTSERTHTKSVKQRRVVSLQELRSAERETESAREREKDPLLRLLTQTHNHTLHKSPSHTHTDTTAAHSSLESVLSGERERVSWQTLCETVYAQSAESLFSLTHSSEERERRRSQRERDRELAPTPSHSTHNTQHTHNNAHTMYTHTPHEVETLSFFDPLHCPPPSASRPWRCSLLLLIPLRLGVHSVNAEYHAELCAVLRDRDCVGLLGGRPRHALYFAGCTVTPTHTQTALSSLTHTLTDTLTSLTSHSHSPQTSSLSHTLSLCGHDPHVTLPAQGMYAEHTAHEEQDNAHAHTQTHTQQRLSRSLLEELHVTELTSLPITAIDPSLAVGFYFRDRESFLAFCSRWQERERARERERERARVSANNKKETASEWVAAVPLFRVLSTAPQSALSHSLSLSMSQDSADERQSEGVSAAVSERASARASERERLTGEDNDDDEYVFL